MFVQFVPFVLDTNNKEVSVEVEEMTIEDAQRTNEEPVWQTSWTSTYIQESRTERYAVKRDEELIALGAYEISENALLVHIDTWRLIPLPILRWMAGSQNIAGLVDC